jgi:hypothetical protein
VSRTYTELYRIDAADGVHFLTVEESDGLFRFVAHELITDEEYGQTYTVPRPIHWSGLYPSAKDAERDARAELAWLPPEISNRDTTHFRAE